MSFGSSSLISLLTAGNVESAGLLVQGEEGQVHGAGAGDGDPATTDITIVNSNDDDKIRHSLVANRCQNVRPTDGVTD